MAAWLPKGEYKIRRGKVKATVLGLLVALLFTNPAYQVTVFAQTANVDPERSVSEGVVLDTSDVGRGLLRISYNSTNQKKIKLMIVKGESRYTYNLKADGSIESFPLQMGNGWYKVCVLENSEGNEYRYLFIKTVNAAINNENDVYLNSIQNINWNYEMEAIKKASELFSGLDAQEQKIKAVYDFITEKIRYDYEKMRNVDTSYVPDIDNTLQAKKGICYDYASLFAAMLRSGGVPVKLVKGYLEGSDTYHAWNEVYLESSRKWMIIDTTIDAASLSSRAAGMYKDSKQYNKVNEY